MAVSSHLNYVRPTRNIINQKCSNGMMIIFTMEGKLYLPMSPGTARHAHILPNIKNSLVSTGALCDARFIVTFRIKYVTVM